MRLLGVMALCLGLSGCVPPGMRLFQAEYRVDGKLLLVASYDESDSVPVPELWESLAAPPVRVGTTDTGIPADPADPRRAILKGGVEVTLVHAGRRLSSATLGELNLVRDTAGNSLWYLAPGEQAKLKSAAIK